MFRPPSRRASSRSKCSVSSLSVFLVSFLISLLAPVTHAACECGYSSSITDLPGSYLFTDLIETDFLHIENVAPNTDWKRQNFSVTAQAGRGRYGTNYTIGNVASDPIGNASLWSGPGKFGGDPGLQLSVGGGTPANGYVPTSQIDSARQDLLWGTYRAALKLTLTPGTCAAFFWYFNDSQEIDMEFLSSQFIPETNTFPVNLVLQSVQSVQQGYNAVGTGNYIIANLPFDPTNGYHEYRIDFVPGNVIYYQDGRVLGRMNTTAIPVDPGHMILTHWSNGNPLWSSGPPPTQANLSVSYVKAYFNSSDPLRQSAWSTRCKNPAAASAVCTIPGQIGGPITDSFFFSKVPNSTIGQRVWQKSGGSSIQERQGSIVLGSLLLLMVARLFGGF